MRPFVYLHKYHHDMQKALTLEEFYRNTIGVLPSEIFKKIGHFNVFHMEDFEGKEFPYEMPYSRKDYYKIALILGPHKVEYADKTFDVKHNMLMFANPQIPYNWTPATQSPRGAYCVFTEEFIKDYGNIREYPLYQPGGFPILDVTDQEAAEMMVTYNKMFTEIAGDYKYKYDVLRNLAFELIHIALKMRPAITLDEQERSNAHDRIVSLFQELLERQFPIESPRQQVHLKSAGDFAGHLNIHLNHLNRVLKAATGKTTSQLIAERIALEARALLKHTNWNISEIAWCLGFEDPSHFIKVFKKNTLTTPKGFRSE